MTLSKIINEEEQEFTRNVAELPLSPDLLPSDGGIEIMRVFLGGWSKATYNGTCVELAARFETAAEVGEMLAEVAREIARSISWIASSTSYEDDDHEKDRLAEIRRAFLLTLDK